ncbi:MAG: hypothetical protein Kow0068_01260 [Marinilabiliales bacterium]
MKKIFIILIATFISGNLLSQNIAITDDDSYTANSSAMLDVKSLTKGFLAPRMTTAQRNAISSPAAGLLVYDTSAGGYYYYNGSSWVNLTSGATSGPFWSYNSPNIYMSTTTDKLGLGTSAPIHKLHLYENVTNTTGADGNFIDIQNANNSNGVMGGIRFQNGTTANTFKGGIFYRDVGSFGTGDLILANNTTANQSNVSAADGRIILQQDGRVLVKGDPNLSVNEAIFAVQNSAGDTIFAVYPEGVRIWVNDDGGSKATGNRGGFAVGGFSPSKAGFTNEYLRVTPDSVRVYIDDDFVGSKATGNRGGFAVGGFSPSKGTITDNYLFVQDDSTRVYVVGDEGFAVDNIDAGNEARYMDLTPVNYLIGHQAGQKITNGQYNTFFGYNAGYETTGGIEVQPGEWEGCNNIFIGYQSGYNNTTGYKNVFMGYKSGYTNTSGVKNTFIGNESGKNNSSGGYNTFIGYNCGISNSTGQSNTFLGANAGFYNSTSFYNVCIGSHAGEYLSSSSHYNTFIGTQAGHGGGTPGAFPSNYITGDYNVALGYQAGYSNYAGSGNIFIGYKAGYSETGSNKLYIENSNASVPLIFGEFDNDRVGINTNAPTANLHIKQVGTGEEGLAIENDSDTNTWSWEIGGNDLFLNFNGTSVGYWDDATGNYVATSDKNLKKDIEVFNKPVLYGINNLQLVSYRLNHAESDSKKTIGFIAQDVQKYFPEIVYQREDGYLGLNYDDFGILAIKAIQEQQIIIDNLKNEIEILKEEINKLKK